MEIKITLVDYYRYYLSLHQHPFTKAFHVVGNVLTLLFLFAVLYFSVQQVYFIFGLIFVPFIVYPFAWFSHLFIEKNKPAAWSSPLMAKVCDWIMIYELLTGKLSFDTRNESGMGKQG